MYHMQKRVDTKKFVKSTTHVGGIGQRAHDVVWSILVMSADLSNPGGM
jgi:hypothetical protein